MKEPSGDETSAGVPSEGEVRSLGAEILSRAAKTSPSLFDPRSWEARLLAGAMKDDSFRTDLLRFIDVLPSLPGESEVSVHVREYLLREGRALPGAMDAALKAAAGGVFSGLASRVVRALAQRMGSRFIAAARVADALPVFRRMRDEGFAFSADLLGEVTLSDGEGDAYLERYQSLAEALAADAGGAPVRPAISIKLSSLWSHRDPVDHDGCVQALQARVLPLFQLCREKNVAATVDMEHWDLHGITMDVFESVAMHPALREWPDLGIVVQAYLVCASDDIERLRRAARARGTPLRVRLVKGAYWDQEVAHARQRGLPCPVLVGKGRTDAAFEELAVSLLRRSELFHVGFGSHNARSVAFALAAARGLGLPADAMEVEMLLGMAEPQRDALRDMGVRVRVYSPVGEILPGVAYLVRRLLESTANAGFLRMTWHDHEDPEVLLAKPSVSPEKAPAGMLVRGDLRSAFDNCPPADFTIADVRRRFHMALSDARGSFPVEVPVAVSGSETQDREVLLRLSSADPGLVVSRLAAGTREDADRAVVTALDAWPAWRDAPVEHRAGLLERLADRLEEDRPRLAALECWEVSKPLREADGDVAEAIDFCRYYARMALAELAPRRLGQIPGEHNEVAWEGRGPTVVVAPWNFPLAILCGMSTAALVSGNPVIMKPAEQSSAVALALFRHMQAAGFPPGAVQLVPGRGEEAGAALVSHPGIAQVAFTGSKAVGLAIWEEAGRTHPGQRWLKRVVCEMGGKNAVIVDSDADVDDAVAGIVRSAFGYAGQKCSACSRVIVVGGAFDTLLRRLAAAAGSLVMAPAHETRCELPPVVDEEAWLRLRGVIADPGPGAEALFAGSAPAPGFFVPPALFIVHDTRHRLMQEELFGPIVALLRVSSFDEALAAASATEYGLTAGLYSRRPSHVFEARQRLRAGNVYINRAITGALVGRQPFGGFGMSGAGTKAGGPGYLLQFAQPRSVCENTERRGLVPGMEG